MTVKKPIRRSSNTKKEELEIKIESEEPMVAEEIKEVKVEETIPLQEEKEIIEITPEEIKPEEKVEIKLAPKESLVSQLITELQESPESATQLVDVLEKITKDWESIGSDNQSINEVSVPSGQSPRSFQASQKSQYVSGYRLCTIFGIEVARIIKDSPKFKIVICNEPQIDSPFVEHGQKAEGNAKKFAEGKLRERGYILGT